MRKFLLFLVGVLTGSIVTIAALVGLGMYAESQNFAGLNMFEEPGECITKKNLKVFQVVGVNLALASEADMNSNIVVLLGNREGKSYYDEQIVKIPQQACAKMWGTYQYETKDNRIKTVPFVEINEQ